MINFNDQVRNILTKNLEKYLIKGFSIRESANFFAEEFYNSENFFEFYFRIFREYLLAIIFLDTYKLLSYKQKECMCNDEDDNVFMILYDIEDNLDLVIEISTNPGFLVYLIEECYNFSELDNLSKINIVKSLNKSENNKLKSIFPIHSQDLEKYDLKIDLGYIVSIIQSKIKNQQINLLDFPDAIFMNVLGFIRNLIKNDRDNIYSLLLDIAKIDYMASKYLVKNVDSTEIKEHIVSYEKYDLGMIFEKLMNNQDFLYEAIYMIVRVYIYKCYEGIELDLDKIQINDSDVIIRKLVI